MSILISIVASSSYSGVTWTGTHILTSIVFKKERSGLLSVGAGKLTASSIGSFYYLSSGCLYLLFLLFLVASTSTVDCRAVTVKSYDIYAICYSNP